MFTNPSQDAHKRTVLTSTATEAANSKVLGKLARALLENVDVVPLQYHNYYLFSTCVTISTGALCVVWVNCLHGAFQSGIQARSTA